MRKSNSSLDMSTQDKYAKVYAKDKEDIKYTKLASRIQELLMFYIEQEPVLNEYKQKNVWIYVVSCRFNPRYTAINIHISVSENKYLHDVLKFFNNNKARVRFYCAKALGKTHNMPEFNFHENIMVEEILEWDSMRMSQSE